MESRKSRASFADTVKCNIFYNLNTVERKWFVGYMSEIRPGWREGVSLFMVLSVALDCRECMLSAHGIPLNPFAETFALITAPRMDPHCTWSWRDKWADFRRTCGLVSTRQA